MRSHEQHSKRVVRDILYKILRVTYVLANWRAVKYLIKYFDCISPSVSSTIFYNHGQINVNIKIRYVIQEHVASTLLAIISFVFYTKALKILYK